MWPRGPSWSTSAWSTSLIFEQKRAAENEQRRLSYHATKDQCADYYRERERDRKRYWRENVKTYGPKEDNELKNKDAIRKRESRSNMSNESLKVARQKHAVQERKRIAELSPTSASVVRSSKANKEKCRRASKSDLAK